MWHTSVASVRPKLAVINYSSKRLKYSIAAFLPGDSKCPQSLCTDESKNSPKPLLPAVWQRLRSRIFLQHLEWHLNQMPERLSKQLHFPLLSLSPETAPARHHICTFRHQEDWQSDSGTLGEWTNSERKLALCVFCLTWLNLTVNIVMFVHRAVLVCTAASCSGSSFLSCEPRVCPACRDRGTVEVCVCIRKAKHWPFYNTRSSSWIQIHICPTNIKEMISTHGVNPFWPDLPRWSSRDPLERTDAVIHQLLWTWQLLSSYSSIVNL